MIALVLLGTVLLRPVPSGAAPAGVLFAPPVAHSVGASQGSAGEATRLNLTFESAQPGTEVTVPLGLEVPQGTKVGKAVSEIELPGGKLTFVSARPGVAADIAAAKLEATVRKDPKRPDVSILTVTARSAESAIPSGVLASLTFKLADDAPAGETIVLPHVAHVFAFGDDSRPVEPVATRNGEIEVEPSEPTVFACFLYMH